MTTLYTPGPWHMGIGNGIGSIFSETGRTRLEDGGTTLYPIASINSGWNAAEDAANGRLIAAAPTMLEALKIAEVALEAYSGNESSDLATIRAAIAKAEGKQSAEV